MQTPSPDLLTLLAALPQPQQISPEEWAALERRQHLQNLQKKIELLRDSCVGLQTRIATAPAEQQPQMAAELLHRQQQIAALEMALAQLT